jgi:hypothetical protein
MPATVYDRTTGQPLPAAPDDLAEGIAAGKYALDANAPKVLLKDAAGTIYHATPDKAATYLASGQYQLPTADEELSHSVEKTEDAKGVLGSLQEGAESAINQGTFGVEEAVVRGGLTPDELKAREARQEYHAIGRGIGGAAGIGASMLYGGEAFKGLELAGEAAGHLVLPAERAAEAGFAAKTAAAAANYATQGALAAAPQAAVQAAFGDPKQAGETILWGLGAGTLLGGGAQLIKSGVGQAAEGLAELAGSPKFAKELDSFANKQALRSAGMQKTQGKKLGELGQQDLGNLLHEQGIVTMDGKSRADLGEAIVKRREEVGQQLGDTIDRLDDVFSEKNGYTVGEAPAPTAAAATDRVRRTGTEIGQYLRDNPDAAAEFASTNKIPERATWRTGPELPAEAGEMPSKAPKPLDDAARGALDAAIQPGDIGAAIRKTFDIPEMRMEINRSSREAFEMIARDADNLATKTVNGQSIVGFQTANDFASSLRGQVRKAVEHADQTRATGVEVATPLEKAKANAYDVVRTFINNAADQVAIASDNPELDRALANSKRLYARMKDLEKMSANYTAQAGNKAVFGLTDTIHAGQGVASGITSTIGAGIGALVGGPGGAVVGGMVGRIPGIALDFAAKRWIENKGLIYLSALAKRAAKEGPDVFSAVMAKEQQLRLSATMDGIGDTIRKMAVEGIQATAAHTNEHMASLLGSTSGLTPDQAHTKLETRLTQLASNPAALAQATAAMASPFVTTAPKVAEALQQTTAQAVTYLHNALPRAPAAPAPFSPVTWSMSPAQKLAFRDKAQIVANPMRAMEHVAAGTLSDAHLDALVNVYPSTYARMKQEIIKFSAEHPDVKLPLAERSSVSKFLGAPLDPITQPDTQRALQAVYSQGPQKPQGGGPQGKPLANGKLKKLAPTPSIFSATQAGGVGGDQS